MWLQTLPDPSAYTFQSEHFTPPQRTLSRQPYCLSAKDWQQLEVGIEQRIGVLQHYLSDLYTKQRYLKKNQLNANQLRADPDYLLNAMQVEYGPVPQLAFYSVDLIQSPSGQWTVWQDYPTYPFGLSHALENRYLLSQYLIEQKPFPEHKIDIASLDEFIYQLQQSLDQALLLSIDPQHPDYYQQDYLAQRLDCAIAQSWQCKMKEGQLYYGVDSKPIKQILCGIPSLDCDALELDPNSTQGITGLMQVWRSGQIQLFNPPGTDIINNNAIKDALTKLSVDELLLPNSFLALGQQQPLLRCFAFIQDDLIWVMPGGLRHNADKTVAQQDCWVLVS